MTITHVLRSMGLDIGHETVGRNGSVCWIWGHPDAERPERRTPKRATDLTHLWQATRDPLASIPSICTDSNRAWAIRMTVCRELAMLVAERDIHPFVKAAASWAYWHRACSNSLYDERERGAETWCFKIEDPGWIEGAAHRLDLPPFRGKIPRGLNSARAGWGNPLNWILRMSDANPKETMHEPTWDELQGLCPKPLFKMIRAEAEIYGYGGRGQSRSASR